jgi:hypothetical protein
MTDKTREQFEAWRETQPWYVVSKPDADDKYSDAASTHRLMNIAASEAWQASRTAALEEAAAWQPIETAPKDAESLLLAEEDYVTTGFWHDGSECYGHRGGAGWFSEDDRCSLLTARNIHPTHWKPLPAAPVETRKEAGT